MLIISPVPFAQLGLPSLGDKSVARLAPAKLLPASLPSLGMVAVLGGVRWISQRRQEVRKHTEERERGSE